MRLVLISDTHGKHDDIGGLSGDVLIHCGDFCHGLLNDGSDLLQIDDWFAAQDFQLILCIGGNHDFVAQRRREQVEPVFQNAVYLQDESYQFGGRTFYGSPWLPDLDGWAYFLKDAHRRRKWKLIPRETDVLITHTPPHGMLDRPRTGNHVGCKHLQKAIRGLPLRVHCFGHVHASYGVYREANRVSVNASLVNSELELARAPVEIDL